MTNKKTISSPSSAACSPIIPVKHFSYADLNKIQILDDNQGLVIIQTNLTQ
jgi:hypothetical protein